MLAVASPAIISVVTAACNGNIDTRIQQLKLLN